MQFRFFDPEQFDSVTPESVKAEAKEQVAAALAGQGLTVDLREGSYTDALLSAGAYQIYKAVQLAADLLAAAVPGEDGGPYLDAFARVYGMTRAAGTKARVQVTFTGTPGAAIPAGTWVCADSGLRYGTLEAAVAGQDGTVTVEAEAEQVGTAYNVGPGQLVRLQFALPGIVSVTGAQAEGGADTETDRAFYARIHMLLSEPVASGNSNNYKQWARACSGVGYAAVLPLWNGNGTVKVVLAGEDKLPVDGSICAAVAAHIDEARPIGAQVTVVSVQALEVTVEAVVVPEAGTAAAEIGADMEAALQQMFDQLKVGAGETVRYNRVLALLLSLPGVLDCTALRLNNGTANLTLGREQVPQLGAVTITTD